MDMTIATVLAQSQGRVWQGTCLMAATRSRMLTRIITTQSENSDMSMLDSASPSRMPPRVSEEVLRYLGTRVKYRFLNITLKDSNSLCKVQKLLPTR